jgi:beta-lactamase class A
MPADQPKFGLGKTTAREMATVMEKIARCDLGGPQQPNDMAICKVVLEMLRNQFYRNAIPRYLETIDTSENGSAIGNKTGSVNRSRNDVAVIAGKSGPMIVSIFTYENEDQSWTADNEAEMTISKLAKEIVQAWSPEGLDPKKLVPGLGLSM